MQDDMALTDCGHMTVSGLNDLKYVWAEMNAYQLCEERKRLAAEFGEKTLWAKLYAEGAVAMNDESAGDQRLSAVMYEGERADAEVIMREFAALYIETDPASASPGIASCDAG